MPRKINKRKKLQAERRRDGQAAEPKPRVAMIAHHSHASGVHAIIAAALKGDK